MPLITLDLPNSLIRIANNAFYDCISLTTINWPDSLTSIGSHAFEDCSSLTAVYFRGNAPNDFGTYVFNGTASDFVIYYLEGKDGWTTPTWRGYSAKPAVF